MNPTYFTIKIELGNDAMQTPDHVATVLAKLANQVLGCCDEWTVTAGKLRDVNGNTVGMWGAQ